MTDAPLTQHWRTGAGRGGVGRLGPTPKAARRPPQERTSTNGRTTPGRWCQGCPVPDEGTPPPFAIIAKSKD